MRGLLVGMIGLVLAACRGGFEELRVDAFAPDGPIDAPVPADYCARIPALAAAPVIDGTLEAGLPLQTLVPVGWNSSELPAPDWPVRFAIGHRPDGLYFAVDVRDPDRFPAVPSELSYCGDGVELYVDHDGAFTSAPDFDETGTRQYIARAPQTATEPRSDGGEYYAHRAMGGLWQAGFLAVPDETGYVVEAFIDAAAVGLPSWTLSAGGHVGIDLSINVSRSDGATVPISECPQSYRLGQYFLRVDEAHLADYAAGAPYYWPTAFCTALLD